MANRFSDKEAFLAAQVPHETDAAAKEAAAAFAAGVRDLRAKYRIAEVLLVFSMNIRNDSGEVVDGISVVHSGAQTNAEPLAAYAYGTFRRQREQDMAALLAGK